ncbi:MAG: Flp pilus assembly complex ATPase component TadA [Thermoleophilaceae bacterium]|nr:Flp pilus assembly complex ATPase component TadA [Thermoleophilaceae bacterium]
MADDPNIPRIGQAAQQKPVQQPQQPPSARPMTDGQQQGTVHQFGAQQAGVPGGPGPPGAGIPARSTAASKPEAAPAIPGLFPPTLKQSGRTPATVVDALVRLGYVGALALAAAVAQAQASGITPEQVLLSNQTVTTDQLGRATAEKYGLNYIDLSSFEIDFQVASLVSADVAKRYEVLPVRQYEDGSILVAMANPANVLALDDLKLMLKTQLRPAVVAPDDLAAAFSRLTNLDEAVTEASDDDIYDDDAVKVDVRESSTDAPVVKLINSILVQAVTVGASDLHFEPEGREMRVRFRVDGVLQRATTVPRKMVSGIISRLKIMSEMDISEKRVPQDGRVALRVGGVAVDLRVVTMPSVFGEKVVIRILDKSSTQLTMDDLGMTPESAHRFETAYNSPYGAVLVTGPTGSGKTTSLYAAVNQLNTIERSILTIEDPVEYQLTGISQVQVNNKAGLTFAGGLRAALRSDPDIIMVGEIRDSETAKIAIEAALTGHLVLSTLHTNDAATTATRLTEMGVEPFLTASALEVVVNQRLARKVCHQCATPVTISAESLRVNGFDADEDINALQAVGCSRCSNGYKGRVGLYEVLSITETIRSLILGRATATEIEIAAVAEGMDTLRQDGLKKIKTHFTTVEEIARVTGVG